jgi:hypothetical protein
MVLSAGVQLWLPCEVMPGPFSDERIVRLRAPGGSWSGHVYSEHLHDDVVEGRSALRATVVELRESGASVRLPGQTDPGSHLNCPLSWLRQFEAS